MYSPGGFDQLRLHFRRIYLAIAIFLLFLCACIGWVYRLVWWTRMYGAELKPDVQRYFEVTDTVAGWTDPNVMAQVATGNRLEDLIRYRCRTCPRIQVATSVHIPRLEVLEYSSDRSKVLARIEWGWHDVDTKTGAVSSYCHAQAYWIVLILAREGSVWKVSDIGDITREERNPVDDTRELRAKYCPSN